jgi:hypothetical protein
MVCPFGNKKRPRGVSRTAKVNGSKKPGALRAGLGIDGRTFAHRQLADDVPVEGRLFSGGECRA